MTFRLRKYLMALSVRLKDGPSIIKVRIQMNAKLQVTGAYRMKAS